MSEPEDALRGALEARAAELEDVERSAVGEGIELRRRGTPFARLGASAASFRLDPTLASAARMTPDTAGSSLGAEWVVFSPAAVDRLALDRAEAWLEAAWRRAGPARPA